MSEEFFQIMESPEIAAMRLNTTAMSHLGVLLSSIEDMVLMNKRLDIKAVK